MTSTLTSLAVLTLAVFLPFAYGDSDEVSEIMASCEAQLSSPDPLELSSALEAGQRMQAFFKVVAGQIHEREYILENLQTALIGRQPVLFVGPPGNAKTRLVTYVLGNILDETTMKPSFFTDQMTFETTISDTHGSINFKALTETGKIERFLEEGVLGNFFSLLDEQFDMRPNALRNILTALADRSYKGIPGKTWMIAGASNKSIPEVYARFPIHDDSARALIDRYAFVFYVPAELLHEKNNIKLIQQGEILAQLPHLSVQDLQKLNALLPRVKIPNHVAHLLSLADFQIKPILEDREAHSLSDYLEKVQRGDAPGTPPWKSTKYMSPRTVSRASVILRARIVYDWILSGGKRDLVASVDDLATLSTFFGLNGPSDEDISFLLTRTTKETEKSQLATVQLERKIFEQILEESVSRFNQAAQDLAPVQDLMIRSQAVRAMKPQQRQAFIEEVQVHYQRAFAARTILQGRRSDMTPELIAQESVLEVVYDIAKRVFPDPTELREVLTSWSNSIDQDNFQPSAAPLLTEDVRTVNTADLEALNVGDAFWDVDLRTPLSVTADGKLFYLKDMASIDAFDIDGGGKSQGLYADKKHDFPILDKVVIGLNGSDLNWYRSLFDGHVRWEKVEPFQSDPQTRYLTFVDEKAQNLNVFVGNEKPAHWRLSPSDLDSIFVGEISPIHLGPGVNEIKNLNPGQFAWQAANGLQYLWVDDLKKLFKFDGTRLDRLTSIEEAAGRAKKKFIGRNADSVFFSTNSTAGQSILIFDSLSETIKSIHIDLPASTPLWVSRRGHARLTLDSQIRLWAYTEEGLTLKTLHRGLTKSQLVLAKADLDQFTDGKIVFQIFEDPEGNVLMLSGESRSSTNVNVVKISSSSLKAN